MRIDIWSDIMCPFCYIGKRRLEAALEHFEHKQEVTITWHSFQLAPDLKTQPGKNIYQYLAERKGQPLDWSVKVHRQMAQQALADGLVYNFDKAVVANSFDAHRLIHLAASHGLGGAAKEALLKAYFTDGKDISDHNVLLQAGMEIGLRVVETGDMLTSQQYAAEVQNDIETAENLGINGVPFFVFDNKYAISGAQPVVVFADGLRQAWAAQATKPIGAVPDNQVCTPDGVCEVSTN